VDQPLHEPGAAAGVEPSTKRAARSTFPGWQAGARGAEDVEPPAKVATLKESWARSREKRRRMSALLVSSGKPCMEPEMSSRKTYSRGGICAAAGRAGGSIMRR
jgi:hypothetical protein